MNPWIVPLSLVIIGALIGLLGWTLKTVNTLMVEIVALRTQVGRLVSDAESEKGTRKRVHDNFEHRIRALEFKQNPTA